MTAGQGAREEDQKGPVVVMGSLPALGRPTPPGRASSAGAVRGAPVHNLEAGGAEQPEQPL